MDNDNINLNLNKVSEKDIKKIDEVEALKELEKCKKELEEAKKLKEKNEQMFFGLTDSIVTNYKEKGKTDYKEEMDEIDKQGYLHPAKNLSLKLIYPHYLVTVEKKNNKEAQCPCCGQVVTKVHDYYHRLIQDVTLNEKPIIFDYVVKRFICIDCYKCFTVENEDFPKGMRYTKRLILHIMQLLKETYSRSSIARQENVSPGFVKRVLDLVAFVPKQLDDAIGIDEFRGNMGEYINGKWILYKYQTIIISPKKGEVINVLKNRYESEIKKFFESIPEEERDKIKYFTCDMNPYFIKLGKKYFKNAKIVIDKFHFVKVIVEAFEKTRKGAQKYLTAKQRRKFKNARKLLLMHKEDLGKIEYGDGYTVEQMLELAPLLRRPYQLLQQFYELMNSKNIDEARMKLKQFYADVDGYKNFFFTEAVKTLMNHEKDILNAFDCPYTNAYVEGKNNLIKVIKRNGYGMKNVERFKKRLDLIVNENIRRKDEAKEHKLIRQEIRRKRKAYRKEIRAAIEQAA